ncbi:MAG: M23 family metallopeptidase, partial [Ignavibacteriaceae bacterium]|nr:M23 family metallopeptidase [Ignavibacteriaceae bacterium]
MQITANLFLLISFLFSSISLAQSSIENLTTSINGTIINSDANPSATVSSENGMYWCTYEVLTVTDEMRELGNFKLYKNANLILNLAKVPGSDIEITNSGKLVFYDHSAHFKGKLKIHFYSKEGKFLFTKEFEDADQFEYSPSGEMMGVQALDGISIISLNSGNSYLIEKGLQFSFSENDVFVAVAQSKKILIYQNSSMIKTIQTGIELPRKTIISSENNLVGVIDKFKLKIYSLSNGDLLFENNVAGDLSFRDLKIVDDKIIAGIHKRNKQASTGLLRIYDLNGSQLEEKPGGSKVLQKFEKLNLEKKTNSNYDPIPWPFFPFDSMRTVWNHYEQHMGLGGTDSYLHQGLDLITPIGEPTYSVIDGYVKLVLTIGGASYWRTAISDTQIAGRSDGWLSAHLIENTIQVDIGDTVQAHDYLGDIIVWSSNWGHIHFV